MRHPCHRHAGRCFQHPPKQQLYLKATGPYSGCARMVSGLHLLWMTVSPGSNRGSLKLCSSAQAAKATWVSLMMVGRIQVSLWSAPNLALWPCYQGSVASPVGGKEQP